MTTTDIIPMLTPEDVAEALKISVRQVRRMAGRGQIPGAQRMGTVWRFRFNETRAWIEGKSNVVQIARTA